MSVFQDDALDLAERIAAALERIARVLESASADPPGAAPLHVRGIVVTREDRPWAADDSPPF